MTPTVGALAPVLVAVLVVIAVWLGLPAPDFSRRRARRGARRDVGSTVAERGSHTGATSPTRGSTAGRGADHGEAMELLALALAAGLPVQVALVEVAEVLGAGRGRDLRTVSAALAWGVGDGEAWAAVSDDWGPTGASLAMARRAGVAPAGLLRAAASDERRRRAGLAQDAAGALAVRLVIPLGLLFLPAFLLTTVLPVILALATDLLGSW